jgi:hypothetical protein
MSTKTPLVHSPSVCFVYEEGDQPSTRWFLYPARFLASAGTCTFAALEHGYEPDADIYVVERALWRTPIERLRAKRRRIFGWLDDAVWLMPIQTPQSEAWKQRWPEYIRLMDQVDGMICPSRLLATDLAALTTTPTHYIPNYHDFPVIAPSEHDLELAGWGGSYFHWTSWRDSGAYKQVPSHLRVEIIDNFLVAEMLRPYNQVELVPALEFGAYLERIATWGFYVIPMAGAYDARRSWIKFLEAAYVGTSVCFMGDHDLEGHEPVAYADCPSRRIGIASLVQWAEAQRITHHLDEWIGVLFDG